MGLSPQFEQEILEVKKLGDKIGYGHLMQLASALWRHDLRMGGISMSGAFVPVIHHGYPTEEQIRYDRYVLMTLDKWNEVI